VCCHAKLDLYRNQARGVLKRVSNGPREPCLSLSGKTRVQPYQQCQKGEKFIAERVQSRDFMTRQIIIVGDLKRPLDSKLSVKVVGQKWVGFLLFSPLLPAALPELIRCYSKYRLHYSRNVVLMHTLLKTHHRPR